MDAPTQEGWQALAAYLRAVDDALWAGLPREGVAEEAWPHLKRAVAAALREGRERRTLRPELLDRALPLDDSSALELPSSESSSV